MGGFFRIDGPFFKYGTLLADLFILTVLWLLFSLPIITMGAGTAALYYVTTRQVSDNEGYVSRDFLKGFRVNFKQGTITIIILFIIYGIILFNITHLKMMQGYSTALFVFMVVIFYETTVTALYAFPMMARFKMKLIDIYKASFSMANTHIFTSMTCFALMAAVLYFTIFHQQILIILVPALYAYITSLMIVRVFRKYRPDFDVETDENNEKIIDDENKI